MLDLMRKQGLLVADPRRRDRLIAVFAFWGVGTGLFNRIKPFAIVDGH